ncbi:RDD family protein [uncultured Arcticibacterium sp.]|uniref:RDD family protein n=1 Tax=uncultured Arcticibacterium sp. TaxID=2173042 RepID=UPI0030F78787
MQQKTLATHLNIGLDFKVLELGQRFGAFIIDWSIKWLYILLVSTITNIDILGDSYLLILILYFPFLFYSFLFEWLNEGRSPGKMILHAQVISATGKLASIYQIAIRWIFNMVDIWLIVLLGSLIDNVFSFVIFGPLTGALFIAFTKNHQRLGDLAANTLVVSSKEEAVDIYDTIYAYTIQKEDYIPQFPEIMRLPDSDISKIQSIMENSNLNDNYETINKLANHVKRILSIKSKLSNSDFLTALLSDYNYYARKQN